MGQMVFIAGILFLSAFMTYILMKRTLHQLIIRRAIKKNKRLLKNMQDKNIDSKYHTYNDLLQYSLLNLRGKMKSIPQRELQNILDKEINRLSQNPVIRFWFSTFLFLKSILSLALIFICFVSVIVLFDEYQVMQEATAKSDRTEQMEEKSDIDKAIDTKSASEIKKEEEEKKQAVEEQKENDEAAKIEAKKEKEKAIYEKGLALTDLGQLKEAIQELEKLDEGSTYYGRAQESIHSIKEELYWSNVIYPTYTEITKSPQNYVGETVGFSGAVNDIIEADEKTLIIVGTEYLGDFYGEHASDILILYPETTDYMEGDFINITGVMKGNFIMTEEEHLIGSYFETPVSFYTSAYTDQNQMPVIEGDYLY